MMTPRIDGVVAVVLLLLLPPEKETKGRISISKRATSESTLLPLRTHPQLDGATTPDTMNTHVLLMLPPRAMRRRPPD